MGRNNLRAVTLMSDSRGLRIDNNLAWNGRPTNTFIAHHTPYHSHGRIESASQSNGLRGHSDQPNLTSSSMLSRIPSCESRIEDLRHKVHQCHLSYLNMEDTPEKLELKSKLEGLIFELLSLVPHHRKFNSLDVANCFNQTVMDKRDFNALDAALSFEKLEKYAANILRHPWRKEFNTIHSYGGSFIHHVSNNIVGSVNILHAMGYHEKKDPSGNTPAGLFVCEDMIDPDKLTKVALGCMIAFVECQVMHQIQSMLKSKSNLKVSFDDIFSVRLRFVGGMDLAVRLLTESNGSASSIPNSVSLTTTASPLSSLNQQHNASSSQYASKMNPVSRNRVTPSSISSYDSLRDRPSQPQSLNGQRQQSSVSSISFDLLDYPSRMRGTNDLMLAGLSSPSNTRHSSFHYEDRSNGGLNSPSSLVPPPAMFANDSPSKTRSNQASSHHYQDNAVSNILRNPSHLPRSESDSVSLRSNDYLPNITSKTRNSYLGAETSHFQPPLVPSPPSMSSNREDLSLRSTLESRRPTSIDSIESHNTRIRLTDNPLPVPPRSGNVRPTARPWSCSYCTFVNRRMESPCEVCFKSRDKAVEASPLVSGGKECSACTLVNSREATNCRACSADLSDSPTYI